MFDAKIDSTSISNDNNNNNRSRSLLRQIGATLTGRSCSRHPTDTTDESPSFSLLRKKHRSFDNVNIEQRSPKSYIKRTSKTKTPISFSHRLSLLNQVKTHIIGTHKHRQTISSISNDDNKYLLLPSIMSITETKSSSIKEGDQNSIKNEIDSSSQLFPLVNTTIQNSPDKTMILNDSLNMIIDDEKQQNPTPINGINSTLSSSRLSLNKFKDQLTQRARTVMTRSPSLTAIVPNGLSVNNSNNNTEQVYWTEICIERAKDLVAKDINGSSDPYVKVLYGNEEKYATNIVLNNLNPVWNETFTFFIHDLNIPIYFNIFDYDRIGRDEPMGTTKIDLDKLPLEKLYAATLELENEQRNDGKIGIIKISITLTPKSIEFRDEALRTLTKNSQKQLLFGSRLGVNNVIIQPRRTIDVYIIKGRNLKSVDSNKLCSPYIRLKFGTNKKYRTQTIKSTSNPEWCQLFMYDTKLSELPPLELTVFDDSNASGEFIGRGICNLAHLDEERTHLIPVDLEDGAGTIDVFITITVTTALQEVTNDGENSLNVALDCIPSKLSENDFENYNFFSTLRSISTMFDVGRLEIKIYQARGLSSKDINGKSDPFCVVELDSNRLRTHTIRKTLAPIWNKSFVIPVQDIHSILQLTIYDEDINLNSEFIGKVMIPLLTIKNGEKKWMTLKDRKCIAPVKGAIEIEATFIYTNLKAVIRTFNPRQKPYYQIDEKFSVGAIKQHVTRIQNMLKGIVDLVKFIDYCFQWENPWLSFSVFMVTLIMVWNFELYMLPCALLLSLIKNAITEYRRGRFTKPYASLGDETIAVIVPPAPIDEEIIDSDVNTKEQKKSFLGVIQSIQETIVEIQGYIDMAASTLERIKNLFNFTVPWLSILFIIVLILGGILFYYVPLRYLILAFVINKFTKRFRKPKGYIDNNEAADFMSRLPSDVELMRYRELKVLTPLSPKKKNK
ncbi:unnamed protein product [Rotaria sordida]|uniref:C2 domain-containing protein n=1 Tax=Rotaria sordida TaxID=392033 RepID=A0A818Q6S4_9BILA|nr:unnamed protein product [Rotaria sordida]